MLIHWIWFAGRTGMNDRDRLALLEHFGDPEDIFYTEEAALRQVDFLTQSMAESLLDKDLHGAGEVLRQCMDKDIHICTFHDGAYPGLLKNIADPPMVLYYKGHIPDLDGSPVIAAVGTRSATPYGITTARKLGGQIARCGGIIVSGMAAGIDGAAMAGALSHDGDTVGILGCGVDVVYPLVNKALFADVERYGCLMSEFPPGTPPYKWNFPRRNRIISGISNGVLIVEAPKISGALITARQAAEQGRDVFVVPGNVDMPTCEGSNALLREGAISVSNGWHVVSEYAGLYPDRIRPDPLKTAGETAAEPPVTHAKVAQKTASPEKSTGAYIKKEKKTIDKQENLPYSDKHEITRELTATEQAIVDILKKGECLVDDLIAGTGLPASAVLPTLTTLQIEGLVVIHPGRRAALK